MEEKLSWKAHTKETRPDEMSNGDPRGISEQGNGIWERRFLSFSIYVQAEQKEEAGESWRHCRHELQADEGHGTIEGAVGGPERQRSIFNLLLLFLVKLFVIICFAVYYYVSNFEELIFLYCIRQRNTTGNFPTSVTLHSNYRQTTCTQCGL